jgi:hypothetical protein
VLLQKLWAAACMTLPVQNLPGVQKKSIDALKSRPFLKKLFFTHNHGDNF